MAFSYQTTFTKPTENVSHELMFSLMRDHNTAWKVQKIRKIKSTAHERDWTQDEGYKDWLRRLSADQRKKLAEKDTEAQGLAWADGLKRDLPLIIFIGNFDETLREYKEKPGKPKRKPEIGRWRKKEGLRLNGLCVIDADHVVDGHDPENVRQWWQTTAKDLDLKALGMKMVFISASGNGVKIVFEARLEWGNLIDNQLKMAEMMGVRQYVDEKCKDGSRGHFITTEQDLIYIDESHLYDYYNEAFNEKWIKSYRSGHTQPTLFDNNSGNVATEKPAATASEGDMKYEGVAISKIISAWLGGEVPPEGKRHDTMRDLARDIRYCLENTPAKVMKAFETQQWIQDLIADGDPVETTVEGACKQRYYNSKPQKLREALEKVGIKETTGTPAQNTTQNELPLAEWGARIAEMFDVFPCLREACDGKPTEAYPAALFTSAAMFGTLLTRTWYYFYHKPEERRHLNYCIYIIGDPASGKSFAGPLYHNIMAPLRAEAEAGYKQLNNFKSRKNERETMKDSKKEGSIVKPSPVIRIAPPRTANGVFIEMMQNAKEIVGQDVMQLHMFTFDSELENSTLLQRGGAWIDKQVLELKAFHNEDDGQAFGNYESVMGEFFVYWNYVYTGTRVALNRKVTERNFGNGLSTRLACIPMPSTGFKMMERHPKTGDCQALETLRNWAFEIEKTSGELPIEKLVDECWEWCNEHMAISSVNNDRADEMLIKRVPYYGIGVSVPFIMMRHWDEWQEKRTLDIDDKDVALCALAMDIQYRTQHYFFGEYAKNYFDNCDSDKTVERVRHTKTTNCYEQLPERFSVDTLADVLGIKKESAYTIAYRWCKDGVIGKEKSEKDERQKIYVKLKKSLL